MIHKLFIYVCYRCSMQLVSVQKNKGLQHYVVATCRKIEGKALSKTTIKHHIWLPWLLICWFCISGIVLFLTQLLADPVESLGEWKGFIWSRWEFWRVKGFYLVPLRVLESERVLSGPVESLGEWKSFIWSRWESWRVKEFYLIPLRVLESERVLSDPVESLGEWKSYLIPLRVLRVKGFYLFPLRVSESERVIAASTFSVVYISCNLWPLLYQCVNV